MADQGFGGGRSAVKDCLRVVMALLAVVVLLFGWGIWQLRRQQNPSPPDVRALADSASARTADHAATQLTDHQLSLLRAATPWASYLGTSVVDGCTTELMGGFMASTWTPAGCERQTVVYAAFNGDIQQRLRQLDTAVDALHWHSQQTLLSKLDAFQQPPGDTTAEVSADYGPDPDPGPQPDSLDVSVTQKPGLPQGYGLAGWQAEVNPQASLGNSYRAATVAWQPLSAAALAKAAYAAHGYLLAFTFSAGYYPPPTVPTPADPPATGYAHCFSGSDDCD